MDDHIARALFDGAGRVKYDESTSFAHRLFRETLPILLDNATLATAIADPGLFVKRGDDDSLVGWQARAVREVLLKGNEHRAERG
jgi:hypothetical protein